MSFYEKYLSYRDKDIEEFCKELGEQDVIAAINKENLSERDFLALLSPKAAGYLEAMARRARQLTLQHFGRVVFLYTPMYLANFCVNQCVYCGFNTTNKIVRKQLEPDEVEREAQMISATGLRHILILTGESRQRSSLDYIIQCVQVLKKYFTSISIEVYPMDASEYKQLVEAGVDGFTIYQEVYNEDIYSTLHLKGPKRNYLYRLDAPERACMASMRSVGIGALLGLGNWVSEAFFTGLHAHYLHDKYTGTEISVSFPRIRPHAGRFQPKCHVSDKELVQIMLAMRLFIPRAGLTISTRENARFRDNLVGIGITKMSAGSSTEVGGHAAGEKSEKQFDISDKRGVDEIRNMLYGKGYQPVFKDWQAI